MNHLNNLLKIVREESFSPEMEQMGKDATAEFETIRANIRQLHDTNAALVIYNRRIRLVITLCIKAFDLLDAEGGLFVPQVVKDIIKQAREQVRLLDNSLASSLEICENVQ